MKNPTDSELEVWMRGPIPDVPDLLQGIAHAVLQVNEDIQKIDDSKINKSLWVKPFGMACIAFHIQHIAGVTERMLTYSRGESLSEKQFEDLRMEGVFNDEIQVSSLKENLSNSINNFVEELKKIDSDSLTQERFLGRKKIPTTQIGLLFHAAEHAQRHYGQLLTTIKVLPHSTGIES